MAGYGDDAGFAAWMAENGYVLPGDAPSPAILRNRGSQYIDAVYGSRFVGRVADYDQERAWPRTGAIVNGARLPSDAVPKAVIFASYFAALEEANNPGSLQVTGSSASMVKREKVGPLEVEYQSVANDGTAVGITPLISIVDGMLAPFLCDDTLMGLGIWSVG